MKFAIRDDDTCYFTKVDQLKKAYSFIEKGPISLAVVTNTVPRHAEEFPFGKGIWYKTYNIKENKELINYLKKGIKENRYEILLHGSTHEYKKIKDKWIAEMIWKEEEEIFRELKRDKNFLEKILDTKIKTFVAPNNLIDKKGILSIERLKMNFSGIIYLKDRRINFKYIKNFIYRWGYRLIKRVPYGGVLNYGKHEELVAYPLGNLERLKKEYHLCKEKNNPFVIYTHYWDILRSSESKKCLEDIVRYITNDGAELVKLSECFKGD